MKLTDSVYSVGTLNPNMRVFDIVMRTDYGTSYNSYLVRGEKTALIETCHETFFEPFLENISAVCDPKEIQYVILNHTEPDHSGSLRKLLQAAPNAEVYCSRAAAIYLKNITNLPDFKAHVVQDGETLDLGDGKVLKFINAPFLHWPDSMFTWFEKEKVLFSCDFLGAHYCEPRMIDTHVTYPDAYETAVQGYFDAIFGPFKPYVLQGLEKIDGLPIEYCCTSHGPVLTKDGFLPKVLKKYDAWAQPHKNPKPLIPLFFCSAYHNTAKVAAAIRQGIQDAMPEASAPLYDIIERDMSMLAGQLDRCDAFLIGSPTINRDAVPPVWNLLSHACAITIRGKQAAAFGSYGWSGEAVPSINQRLTQLGIKPFSDGLKVNFVPTEEDLNKAREFGRDFANALQNK